MPKYKFCSEKKYKKYFSGKSEDNNTKAYNAYQFALDTRKFEIELYWNRSNLFWSFVGVAFTGYFALLALDVQKPELLLLISVLGWLFSIIWYFVCRGSKYWQENWEKHIDLLEDQFAGPIYKIIGNPKKCKLFNPVDSYPISVSKLNMLLSLSVAIIWIALIIYSIKKVFSTLELVMFIYLCLLIVFGLFLSVLIIILFAKTNTKIVDDENTENMIIRDSNS